ncbi:MAG: beta-lactamase family protein [Dehalococcoidia bacterium]|nr:beta-lactamase family protein [Dehalococcoidia bacterium]
MPGTSGAGLTEAGRARIESVARDHLGRGWHTGAQVAVYRHGRLQVDLALGEGTGKRMLWFSATKPVTAVAVLMLAERGALDLDAPIAEVWPEFGHGGKERCTTRHVLMHQGGFPVFPPHFDWARMDDWEAVATATAALPAQWEPGTDTGYHPVTYGFALGEVIRRVDGREPRDFLRDEIFEPLGMAASLGTRDIEDDLNAVCLPLAMSEVTMADPEGAEARTSDIVRRFTLSSTLRGQLPAANGIGTAEALARFYAAMVNGGEREYVRLLSPEMVALATSVQVETDFDRTSNLPASYGLGFAVGGIWPPFDVPRVFGHGGQQCAISWGDPDTGIAAAYLTNGLHDPYVVQVRTEEMFHAIREACA